MAARLQLQIQGSTDFTFDVEGEWTPSVEPVYKEGADPPQLAQLRHVWEFRGCRILSSDNTQATLWDEFLAFVARFEDRDNHPTYVQLVRDPSGSAVVEWKLDGTTYEQLRFELIQGETDPLVPDASWVRTATVSLRISAVRKFADANGVVEYNQRVLVSYVSGLRTLEWQTRIVTASGVDAVAKAKSYAAIDVSALPTYCLQTGNHADGGGIDWEVVDADEQAGRTPTVVDAISRVQQFGITIGASGAGAAPDEVSLVVTTTTTTDETLTTTEAWARGPNAQSFVVSQKPGGTLRESETVDDQARDEYRGRWVRSTARQVAEQQTRTVSVTVTGGKRTQRWSPIAAGLEPIRQVGAFQPYKATVSVMVHRQGGDGKLTDMQLPGLLGDPWHLDPDASTEGLPEIAERAVNPAQHKWQRRADLVFYAAKRPPQDPLTELGNAASVPTYYLA